MAFLLLIGIIEFSLLFFTTLSMQYALREGARYAVTGRTDKQATYAEVLARVKAGSMGMYDSLSPTYTVNGATYATDADYNANMFGTPGQIVVIRVDCTWKLATPLISALFPNGQYKFSVATTMMNEWYNVN